MRLLPEKPFPPYVFIPGVNPHPKKEGGYREGIPEPVATQVEREHPEQNEFFNYALDLFNHGYFWESHVYFEALWNAHGRVGSAADFFKGMIKLGAAGVKVSLKQTSNAVDHYLRARELFSIVMDEESEVFLGINLREIIQQIDQRALTQGLLISFST